MIPIHKEYSVYSNKEKETYTHYKPLHLSYSKFLIINHLINLKPNSIANHIVDLCARCTALLKFHKMSRLNIQAVLLAWFSIGTSFPKYNISVAYCTDSPYSDGFAPDSHRILFSSLRNLYAVYLILIYCNIGFFSWQLYLRVKVSYYLL